ncbi:hypothetical protein EGI26_19305 [Lacihabitans sp. CCS-44]|uniref:Cj0069 family protein n=1 Tax=Lacihabitans sp. CCS-44 TaxID=2487331 RepID=UPI0020CE035A|nr:Cj0069 family protein [Lacihabitans sp. CCS-44]MCP9757314.1 hypothetical protein [Lacihabitans sp. CCS-44]
MKKNIVIFEVEGGSDKWLNGLRKDTMPIVNAIKKQGWDCEIIYFRDEWKSEIFDYVSAIFSGYISRINPGNLPKGEKIYLETLRALHKVGLAAMSHPDEMLNFGSKYFLLKLKNTPLVKNDTHAYFTIEEFRKKFPFALAQGERVLKQNRGSTGVGIWKVQVWDNSTVNTIGELPIDTLVKYTEAKDNKSRIHTLDYFMKMCEKYIVGEQDLMVDMPFLPRIKEGEYRVLMIGDHPSYIIHKKPVATTGAFSATLFSGATYSYHSPIEYIDLATLLIKSLPTIKAELAMSQLPLIWTADFILDTNNVGKDLYVLSEVNCSCVGIPENLIGVVEHQVAFEAIKRIESNHACRID